MEVALVPCLEDNYAYLLRSSSGKALVIDPSESVPILNALKEHSCELDVILNTHHHWDHTDGNAPLKKAIHCQQWGNGKDAHRIFGMDRMLSDGETVSWEGTEFQVLSIPGHTLGHVAYYFPREKALFCGDTLFSLGCGRLFEGTPTQMWESLKRLRELPDDTKVYCGHEYTLENAEFAVALTQSDDWKVILEKIKKQRARLEHTVPSLLGWEKKWNPYMLCDDPSFQKLLGTTDGAETVLEHLRHKKDQF